ncbi:DNA-directed RNA polymerase subunit beta' [candidate division WWE3 bacterium]|jgi:DNA-directed RNA polymerase subunit beta'|uniref:DNA-directed RNA polymerase subunit beta' n=1 Tax=candidate division WWE3 bacterium TaxID=2053526 RepID=A0A3A4ZEC5_UNCKA|nr:MAG: DNA-directed RNA polymerase subunit beta' [candidate division WWE3 bacterium]
MKDLNQLRNFDAIKIYLASNEEILSWSFGEVTKPETINYRTFKSEREGLFDERIFGPVKNFECYCGKYRGIRYKGVICDKCGVEVTHSRVRRERMGHIGLASPIAHIWFFKGIPSKMALLLDLTPRNVESVIYFASFIITEIDNKKKAEAISEIEKDLEKVRVSLNKEFEEKAKDFEKEISKLSKEKDELKAQEEVLKVRQKIQALRNSYDKKIEDQEKVFKLMQKKIESVELYSVISDAEYVSLSVYLEKFCELEIGAEALQGILKKMNLNALSQQLRDELESSKGQKAAKISKRLKVVEQFRRASISPDRMILNVIPVIPPDLRPMVQLEGGRFASSDLNELYRRLINRNNRLKRLLDLGAPEIIVRNEKRMLQEAVDALFDSSKQRQKNRVTRGKKELRSLADMIKGKQGIFRLNLLGKRVDYSGRGVIINGPNLKLNECGLPKEMALELFKPMVLREVLSRGYAPNVKSAKYFVEQRSDEVWDILEEIVKDHPVLLNRAPTLWRLGIQAFYPKLIEGNAIRLHLCVCSGFNADFDGDQMAVHVPLSQEAKEEARNILISTNNLLNPSNGVPYSVPTKIMLFGVYYMTSIDEKLPAFGRIFSSKTEMLYALYVTNEIDLRQNIKIQYNSEILETTPGRILFNEIIPETFGYLNQTMDKKQVVKLLEKAFDTEANSVVVNLIDDIKGMGLKYGTLAGQSVSLSDIEVPEAREGLINKGKESVAEIEKNYKRGLITRSEAQRLTEDAWNNVIAELDNAVWDNLEADNPVKVLVKSGSTRASRDQVKQISGMKGVIVDPTGKVVEMPILGNYKYGLSALEYFVGARGARKGLVDKGLKTADAGYLTRRLVDVVQDVLVRDIDCGTERGRSIKVGEGTMLQTFAERMIGRILAEDVKDGRKVLVKRNTILSRSDIESIEKAGVPYIIVRSPLHCETRRGICAYCYGNDLMTGKIVGLGTAVGVAAAQSIGEPGTQLTMRTFHTGGIAGKDITQGLPRVEELVEARSPKFLSTMSEITGTVKIIQNGDERKILVTAADPTEEIQVAEYYVDPVAEIVVEDEQIVARGDRLTAGHLDLTDLLRTVGVDETKKYIIDEVQKVYASQGVALNDKHIEVIVKQMFNHVKIEDQGDTKFMAGEIVTKAAFEEENEEVLAGGGTPATAKLTLLGITKASLNTDSFLAAASFIQTSNVLTDAAASGKVDNLLGLKENVIIGREIPTGEGARLE